MIRNGGCKEALVRWGQLSSAQEIEELNEVVFRFAALSVGHEIMVEHLASGTKNHLTSDVCGDFSPRRLGRNVSGDCC
jgi:hypothetical protein